MGGIVGKLFGGKQESRPAPPTLVSERREEPVMPDPDDKAIEASSRRDRLRRYGTRGRMSTLLTGADTKLGGDV
jgi:hypothetical protein